MTSDAESVSADAEDALSISRSSVRAFHPRLRPAPKRHGFRTPPLPTPVIERPTVWPATSAGRDEVLRAVVADDGATPLHELQRRRRCGAAVLEWLEHFDGVSWQQRWLASGANQAPGSWWDLVTAPLTPSRNMRWELIAGAARLTLLDVLRPSYPWLYRMSPKLLTTFWERRDPEGRALLERLFADTPRLTIVDRTTTLHQLMRMLIHTGGRLADLTVPDCIEAYRAQVDGTARQHAHWYLLLRQAGILPADSPPTVWAASRRGQLTVKEMVDVYGIECREVRDLLVAYLRECQAGLDYSTLRVLSSKRCMLFWRDLELHEPGISSLALTNAQARGWKERLLHIEYDPRKTRLGQRRQDPNTILIAVRAFYADLNQWALEDPERWRRWAAPNPVNDRDLAGQNKLYGERRARMHQRTRDLAPVLPALVRMAALRRDQAHDRLTAARTAAPGQVFEVHGDQLVRAVYVTDPERGGSGRPGLCYADDPRTGRRRNLTLEEEYAFWAWAVINVLQHTGVRVEEMLEITHRSFVAYTLPSTAEVVPLLQITPSKTDRERLLVVSPELGEVLAAIIRRVSAGRGTVPLVSRYEAANRLHSPALPFLFQRPYGLRQQVLTTMRVKHVIDQTMAATGLRTADGQPMSITPHDFRRIFATEAVASGLPVHIAAKLLGHESINTTQGYVAVYEQDVVDHHRAYIARRRSLRPSEEYREPTDAEWDEFLSHFEKRKVELGVCGRAYATPCIHEHACIRCPMLRPDPAQLHRLIEIRDNIKARMTEARQRGWLGEIEGLEVSLAGAEQKLTKMHESRAQLVNPLRVIAP